MRMLFVLVYDLLVLAISALLAPLRLLPRRSRFLVFELRDDPPWRHTRRSWLSRWRAERHPLALDSLQLAAERLGHAAADPAVRGVVVKVEDFSGPGIKLQSLRSMLEPLAAAGKQVVFYGREVTTREYALMASGSRVQLAPGGQLDLRGFAAQLLVAGELLQRAGASAHFLRRGTYKTAPELFTDREVSRAQRESIAPILDEQYDRAVAAIARGRRMDEQTVRRLVDEGPFGAERALAAGLVDAIGDAEDLEVALAAPGQERARLQPLAEYRGRGWMRGRLRPLRRPARLARVPVHGVLRLGEGTRLPLLSQAAGCDPLLRALRRAREDKRIAAVVLDIDSRGGSSLASELLLAEVRRLAEKKPVVAYLERYAASGGYLVAVGAPFIVTAPGTITGSIGVFAGKIAIGALLDRLGVGRAVLRRGQNSALELPLEGFSDTERRALEREIEATYSRFLDAVAAGRRKSRAEIEPHAEGRIFTGRRAVELGLADAVGDFELAVAEAARRGGLKGRPELVTLGGGGRIGLATLRRQGSLAAGLAELRELVSELGRPQVLALADPFVEIEPPP